MPHLQLRPSVSFAIVDGRAVFLDLRTDRYLGLDGAADEAFAALVSSPGSAAGDAAAEALLATNLFEVAARPEPLVPAHAPRPRAASPAQTVHTAARDILVVSALVLQASLKLRLAPIERILKDRHEGIRDSLPKSAVFELADRFRDARSLVPIAPSCLQDSLALRRWLARRQAFATLVVGVKLDPFAAHCWTQLDDIVLNDSPDRVATYTPILVVE